MPVTISRKPRASTGPPPALTRAGERIPERPGALEEHFRREVAFTADVERERQEARRKAGLTKSKEAPMRVRMLQTRRGSQDGIHAELFQAGVVYEMAPSLARPWLERGICELDSMLERPGQPPAAIGPESAKMPGPEKAEAPEPAYPKRKSRR